MEVEALKAELHSQAKWEAVRLQEAVRAQLVEDKKVAAKELGELQKRHMDELVRVREEGLVQAESVVQERVKAVSEKMEKERDEEVMRLLRNKEEDLSHAIRLESLEKGVAQTEMREAAVMKAEAETRALSARLMAVVQQTELAKEATRRTSGAFLLRDAISNSVGAGKSVTSACGESELGGLVRSTLSDSVVKGGVRSIEGLQTDFETVAKRGLSVAVVGHGDTGSMWGHLMGSLFSRLKVRVDVRADGREARNDEERIRLAEMLVEEGDLKAAVDVLEGVEGLAKEVLSDWVGLAKARVAAGLAADVLFADAIVSQAVFTRGA